ncbi:MAG TPA: family 16 glycoside hydrolase [Candidatus Deferrimicrobiaceae bacterium]
MGRNILSFCFAVVLLASASTVQAAAAERWTFAKDPAGKAPAGSEPFSGAWAVRHEPGIPAPLNALCQTGSGDYPAIALGSRTYADAAVSVRFKAISGKEDRAAGVIFRVRDRSNYYIVRANALENNLNIYKYVDGRRSVIREGTATIPSGVWETLRVEARGKRIRAFLNGKLVVEADDETFKAGRVGLWTKADSQSCFAEFTVEPR